MYCRRKNERCQVLRGAELIRRPVNVCNWWWWAPSPWLAIYPVLIQMQPNQNEVPFSNQNMRRYICFTLSCKAEKHWKYDNRYAVGIRTVWVFSFALQRKATVNYKRFLVLFFWNTWPILLPFPTTQHLTTDFLYSTLDSSLMSLGGLWAVKAAMCYWSWSMNTRVLSEFTETIRQRNEWEVRLWGSWGDLGNSCFMHPCPPVKHANGESVK